jgi:DNA-directed RNA polymerase specialized sigma24 family protein
MPRPDLARLFDAEQDRLLALCLRLTNDRATAEDALQDTFLLACRHAGSFRAESTPETWLYRIAIRAAQARRERDRTARTRDRSRPRPRPNHRHQKPTKRRASEPPSMPSPTTTASSSPF